RERPHSLVTRMGADRSVPAFPTRRSSDLAAARDMLRRLSGRTHEVVSAVTVLADGRAQQALSVSRVTFARLDPELVEAYVASGEDRKSTRLNSSHVKSSYAVFFLKKKK